MLTKNYLAIYAKSFNWAGFFLPKKTYEKCSALYDFCREADNIADDENNIQIKKNNFIKFRNNFVNKNYDDPLLRDVKDRIVNYFKDATLDVTDIPLDWSGYSDFYQSVWECLIKIPFGKTTTYSAIAQELNNPKAVRAVGMANGKNPIPIIVPCHRVIGKNGNMQGFYYGIPMKKKLLAIESKNEKVEQGWW